MMPVDLPSGPAPAALTFRHFPDRMHAFVWRNWQLVPADRMARVIGCSRDQIVKIGRSMGLEGPPRISADQLRRSHVTIIRRNWHLLPYDQLLELLGWTAEEMAYSLREDDFLFVKLGNLKPRCDRLVYSEPDAAARARASEIRDQVRRHFPRGVGRLQEPLFTFVKELSATPAKRNAEPLRAATATVSDDAEPRFCYSYFGLYGDPLADARNDPYPEGYLARLAESGVNGVWLQGVLSRLAPFPWKPDMSVGYEKRLANLRRLVQRAKKHGLRVYLYLNEPRAMPLSFFEQHPELRGVTEGDYATLCTSVPEVRRYLVESVACISRAVPDLGGYFTITASENLTNCWSHYGGAGCARCAARSGPEIVADVNAAVAEGIRLAGGRQRVIAWDWGWPDDWAEPAIARLPSETALMSVSEWSLPLRRGGIAASVGEYSLSAVGPGPRATRNWKLARDRGLQTFAKVQAACTWELSAVPYIPAVRLTAEHAANLRRMGLSGVMLGWTLGGYPSPNLEVVREVFSGKDISEALATVSEARYGPAAGPRVVEAWQVMSNGFTEFPFDGSVVYNAPLHSGPANLLWAEPTGYRATMVGIPYDDLSAWRSVYPPDVFVRQMRRVADGFGAGVGILEAAVSVAGPQYQDAVEAETRIARAAASHFRSVAAQAEYVALRDGLVGADRSSEDRAARMRDLLAEELETARELYDLQVRDARIGFEATNQYYYVPVDLAEKALNCLWVLRRMDAK